MSDDKKATVRALFAAIDKAQSMGAAVDFVAPGFLVHLPGMPPMDVEGFKAFGDSFFAACPGLAHEVIDAVAEGDRVAVRLTIRGRHTQPFVTPQGTLPATDNDLVIEGMNMFRFSGDRIAELWVRFDMLGVMQTVGAVPA
jgi:predicted ester cyclase